MAAPSLPHIGVFTSGGDAPGMNAAVRAVVRAAHFHGARVSGILGGYDGMVRGDMRELGVRDVSNIIQRGGTILRTARSEAFRTREGRDQAFAMLQRQGIEALVAIGGNGTFTGASQFLEEHGIPTIGIPGTIDNDLFGTDITLGFDTAVNTAMEAIDRIRDTASSHNRLFFVEVMGRTSGFIALHSAIASGAEFVLVPERAEGLDELIEVLERSSRSKSSVIVIVAEGEEKGGAFEIARKVKERYAHYDTRVSVLGHMQRGGSPTVTDRVLASRMGVAAVEALLAGRSNEMVGLVGGQLTFTPFRATFEEAKPLDTDLLRLIGVLSV
ncbi:MAG TPA: 6-phosphofructokinase [Flavobacteriales bacterium]|jgi:6-phosphofructokinase 1|nr:6-phosphofructokinase [Flavobacteriales bacterium]